MELKCRISELLCTLWEGSDVPRLQSIMKLIATTVGKWTGPLLFFHPLQMLGTAKSTNITYSRTEAIDFKRVFRPRVIYRWKGASRRGCPLLHRGRWVTNQRQSSSLEVTLKQNIDANFSFIQARIHFLLPYLR